MFLSILCAFFGFFEGWKFGFFANIVTAGAYLHYKKFKLNNPIAFIIFILLNSFLLVGSFSYVQTLRNLTRENISLPSISSDQIKSNLGRTNSLPLIILNRFTGINNALIVLINNPDKNYYIDAFDTFFSKNESDSAIWYYTHVINNTPKEIKGTMHPGLVGSFFILTKRTFFSFFLIYTILFILVYRISWSFNAYTYVYYAFFLYFFQNFFFSGFSGRLLIELKFIIGFFLTVIFFESLIYIIRKRTSVFEIFRFKKLS